MPPHRFHSPCALTLVIPSPRRTRPPQAARRTSTSSAARTRTTLSARTNGSPSSPRSRSPPTRSRTSRRASPSSAPSSTSSSPSLRSSSPSRTAARTSASSPPATTRRRTSRGSRRAARKPHRPLPYAEAPPASGRRVCLAPSAASHALLSAPLCLRRTTCWRSTSVSRARSSTSAGWTRARRRSSNDEGAAVGRRARFSRFCLR